MLICLVKLFQQITTLASISAGCVRISICSRLDLAALGHSLLSLALSLKQPQGGSSRSHAACLYRKFPSFKLIYFFLLQFPLGVMIGAEGSYCGANSQLRSAHLSWGGRSSWWRAAACSRWWRASPRWRQPERNWSWPSACASLSRKRQYIEW